MGQTKQRSTTNVFPTALLVVVMALAMIFATPPQATLSAHAEGTTVDLSTLTENYTAQDGDTLTGTLDGDERPYSISIADGATVTPKNAIINGGTVYAKGKYDSGEAVPYLAWDESSQSVKSVAGGCATYTVVASDTTVWGVAGTETWYVVSNDTTINSRVVANGTVNLILCDGATLTVPGGIQVTTNNTLSIFEQAESTGAILINGVGDDNAGIGGARNARGGTINIHGGTITVSGGGYGAGIGGGYRTAGGNITIYGGTITVSGGRSAAGIGGGYREPKFYRMVDSYLS